MPNCSLLAFIFEPKGTGHGSLNSTLASRGSDPHHHSSGYLLALGAAMSVTSKAEAVRVPEQSVESSASAVEWAAIVGGALGAVGISIILFTLGSGLGLSTVSPWSFSNPSPTTFGVVAGVWLIITQWLASALGGYLTGRLRTKWVGIRTEEVFFRDSAHGFLAWALATVLAAVFFALAAAAVASAPDATANAPSVSAEAAEQARRAAAAFSVFTSLSLLIGAFIGSVSGALGGYHRDEV
jgi:MFS family permease